MSNMQTPSLDGFRRSSRSLRPQESGELLRFTRQDVGWKWMSFLVRRLVPGQVWETRNAEEETVVLMLGGTFLADWGEGRQQIGQRKNVSDGHEWRRGTSSRRIPSRCRRAWVPRLLFKLLGRERALVGKHRRSAAHLGSLYLGNSGLTSPFDPCLQRLATNSIPSIVKCCEELAALPPAPTTKFRLFLVHRRPAHTRCNRRPVVFALDHVLRAAIVEAEDLVIDIEAIHDKAESVGQADTALGIELEVWVEIIIAKGAGSAVAITSNVLGIVGQAHANGETTAIVCGTDVPSMGCIAHCPRTIRATGQSTDTRCGIAIVG